jgi:hypothetical protein
VFKKQNGNIMSSPSMLRHMKVPSATSVETGLMASKISLPGHLLDCFYNCGDCCRLYVSLEANKRNGGKKKWKKK